MGKTKLNLKSHHDTLGRLHQTKTDFHPPARDTPLLPPPVTIPSSLPPRAISPSSLFPELPAPAIAERPSSQPEQNPERWNPSPGAPRRPLGMLRRQSGWGRERPAPCAPAGSSRGRAASASRAGGGRVMAAAAAGSASGGSSSSGTSSTGEEERTRRLFQTCDGDGDGYISRYSGRSAGLAGARPASPRRPSPLLCPIAPNFPQVAAKLTGNVARDSESASPARPLRPRSSLLSFSSGGAGWCNFPQRCLCLGTGRPLFRRRVLLRDWERSCLWGDECWPLAQVGEAALQPQGVKTLWPPGSGLVRLLGGQTRDRTGRGMHAQRQS